MVKNKVARFFMDHGVDYTLLSLELELTRHATALCHNALHCISDVQRALIANK